MLAIEKNIALPTTRRGNSSEFPFAKMKAGDSFLLPIHGKTGQKGRLLARKNVATAMWRAKKALGFEFTLRTLKEGIRVWRVK